MQVKQLLTRTAGAMGVTAGLLFASSPLMAQMKVGGDPNNINTNSILELESAGKGLLQPRVELTGTNSVNPMSAPVPVGMRVYNTATTSGIYAVSPGEYYYDGVNWVRLITQIPAGMEIYEEGTVAVGSSCAPHPEGTIRTDIAETSTGQQWICRSGAWQNYDSPATAVTPFFFDRLTDGVRVDAGSRKGGTAYRFGSLKIRNQANSASATLNSDGGLQLYRNATIAPSIAGYINFAGNPGNLDRFQIAARNDFNANQGALAFMADGQPRMVVGLNGQVGIGTTNPLRPLHVKGAALFSDNVSGGVLLNTGTAPQDGIVLQWDDVAKNAYIAVQSSSENLALTKRNIDAPGGSPTFVAFRENGSILGRIIYNPNANPAANMVFAAGSDRRLKENIRDTHYSIEDLMKIGVMDYNFKRDKTKTRTAGIIAQDLFKVYPEAVVVGGASEETDPWMVDYGKLTPILIKSVQDQQKEIESLKAQLSEMNALKAEVASIKAMLGNAEQQKSEATISK